MPGEVSIPAGALVGFVLVFSRLAGVFILVPIPGIRTGPDAIRIVLALSLTVGLMPRWPQVQGDALTIGGLVPMLFAEFVFGQTIGLATAVLAEAFVMGAQVVSLQAGFNYASMVDPTTQAESGSLLVIAQLTAGMLFFAFGLDREVLRILIESLTVWPVGTYRITGAVVEQWTALAGTIFSAGIRLALPAIALLLLVDLSFGLLSRLRVQLQLLSLLFSGKMLVAVAVLSVVTMIFPSFYRDLSTEVFAALRSLGGR
jgi:flagellar biosynthesis protein FliR